MSCCLLQTLKVVNSHSGPEEPAGHIPTTEYGSANLDIPLTKAVTVAAHQPAEAVNISFSTTIWRTLYMISVFGLLDRPTEFLTDLACLPSGSRGLERLARRGARVAAAHPPGRRLRNEPVNRARAAGSPSCT